jgi:hypothetical protein
VAAASGAGVLVAVAAAAMAGVLVAVAAASEANALFVMTIDVIGTARSNESDSAATPR